MKLIGKSIPFLLMSPETLLLLPIIAGLFTQLNISLTTFPVPQVTVNFVYRN
jgi:hypothetical protein